MKISVLGTGRWASTNIWIAVEGGHTVMAWDKFETPFMQEKKNRYVDLSNRKEVVCNKNLAETLNYGDLVIISILSQEFDNLMQEISQVPGFENKKYCLAMKGIEATTGRTLSEIMMSYGVNKNNIAILAGPGQPNSIAQNECFNTMVVSSYDFNLAKQVQGIIKTDKFTLYPWSDVQGCEICAAAKNIYSALGGMCEGGNNATLKGALMSVSINEMEKILKGMGCNPKTASHLALLADYNATLYDPVSHNLTYGKELVKQNTSNPTLDFNSVEGRQAATGLIRRIIKRNAELSYGRQISAPLLYAFKDIVDEKIAPSNAVNHIHTVLDASLNAMAEEDFRV